ncbi:hypothetical protein MQE35_03310 [Abyssalbus ytuae]|uniref:Uncharacterized protein n=1 Tax=Abyssalbus ytuae TaxID=2926907 RepID=A0A9E7D2N0_9FLAO|nr:hypothetical protein [Abyssalbus ytuae]UOB18323.1 hypothetical protein MQE35_03310 [Abyssalbus ytuae]
MFTGGKLIFAVLFIIVFVLIMIYSYKQDKVVHQKSYKNAKWVLIGFIIFLAVLLFIKYLLNK